MASGHSPIRIAAAAAARATPARTRADSSADHIYRLLRQCDSHYTTSAAQRPPRLQAGPLVDDLEPAIASAAAAAAAVVRTGKNAALAEAGRLQDATPSRRLETRVGPQAQGGGGGAGAGESILIRQLRVEISPRHNWLQWRRCCATARLALAGRWGAAGRRAVRRPRSAALIG